MNGIYADHAATTRLRETAFEAMKPYLLEQYGNPSQPYTLGQAARRGLEEARATVAACIGARPGEVVFTGGGTESDNWAIKGWATAQSVPGRIAVSAVEHHAVKAPCRELAHRGWEIIPLPVTAEGRVEPETLEKALTPDTGLVSVMTANNELGTLQPIRELCEATHRQGAVFHTDSVAAIGHIPVDVHALGVDLLSASGHKFGGPKGIGFLYIREGTPLLPYLTGGGQESGRRAGTEQVAGAVGLAAALQEACTTLEETAAHLRVLEQRVLDALTHGGAEFRLNGGTNRVPGLLSLSFRGEDGERLLHRLDLCGIWVSTGAACDSRRTRVSPVLEAIGAQPDWATGTLRLSFGRDNTAEEADTLARELLQILKEEH